MWVQIWKSLFLSSIIRSCSPSIPNTRRPHQTFTDSISEVVMSLGGRSQQQRRAAPYSKIYTPWALILHAWPALAVWRVVEMRSDWQPCCVWTSSSSVWGRWDSRRSSCRVQTTIMKRTGLTSATLPSSLGAVCVLVIAEPQRSLSLFR